VGVLQTVCPDGSQTVILPISGSQVARITGMSYQHPLLHFFYSLLLVAFTHFSIGSPFIDL
jgi:hypothetical protein